MSIKKVETKITTYQITDNFFVEAQEIVFAGEEIIEFWIYHKQYGVKSSLLPDILHTRHHQGQK